MWLRQRHGGAGDAGDAGITFVKESHGVNGEASTNVFTAGGGGVAATAARTHNFSRKSIDRPRASCEGDGGGGTSSRSSSGLLHKVLSSPWFLIQSATAFMLPKTNHSSTGDVATMEARMRAAAVVFGCTALLLLFHSTREFWLGDAYSRTGGIVGVWVDKALLMIFIHCRRISVVETRYKSVSRLPDVTIKATRKTERAHSSTYLLEQLARGNVEAAHYSRNYSHDASGSEREPSFVNIQGIPTLLSAAAQASTLRDDLSAENCTSNWLCQRCLSFPLAGSFAACSTLCRRCYARILATLPYPRKGALRIATIHHDNNNMATEPRREEETIGPHDCRRRRIPRIIHQSWGEVPRTLEHPELVRLQNGWRSASGFVYHFYTPKARLAFIAEHYGQNDPIVVHAYQALKSDERQLQFFQLLVLYRTGGVFAGINVKLETNLDALLNNPNVALMIPRNEEDDDVTRHGLQFCLWSNLVAAEPGHPVLGQMIESFLVQFYLGMFHDMELRERWILHHVDPRHRERVKVWQIRLTDRMWQLQQHTIAVGGCDWGMLVNMVGGLGHETMDNPLNNFALGAQRMTNGDLVVLVMSRHDTGATRITDIDRNLLVASVDLVGLDLSSIQERSQRKQKASTRKHEETIP